MAEKRILYVDDEAPMRDLIKAYLGMEGYWVSTASDGEEAIAILGKDSYDVVLLDYHMPKANGLEVLKFMRERGIETQVVVLSGDDGPAVIRACEEFGVAEYLPKPFDVTTLLSILEN